MKISQLKLRCVLHTHTRYKTHQPLSFYKDHLQTNRDHELGNISPRGVKCDITATSTSIWHPSHVPRRRYRGRSELEVGRVALTSIAIKVITLETFCHIGFSVPSYCLEETLLLCRVSYIPEY